MNQYCPSWEENETSLGTFWDIEIAMTALQNKYYSEHLGTIEEKGGQRTLAEKSWKKKCGQRLQVQLRENGDGSTRKS